MERKHIEEKIKQLGRLSTGRMHMADFLLTWEKTDEEIAAVFTAAEILRGLRRNNLSARFFDSGLAISIFRDNSTRTRFSFASAANFLGLALQDLDEGKSQIAHGETVRETANMVSFMADVIGIRDDMYIGRGNAYMREVAAAVQQGFDDGILEQRPTLVNLQCDIDHPTQSMSDMLHLINRFDGLKNLRGKKIAMAWAYSPSYGKPLSVPQGVVGLMTRFGMEVVLAHPPGYEVMPDVEEVAVKNAQASGGTFRKTNSMEEAFEDADIVYGKGDLDEIRALEKELLDQIAEFQDWDCTEDHMKKTRDGNALYMHCLPADITGVNCREGEVAASVFDRYRTSLYVQAGYKPYIAAAMILLARFADPASKLIHRLKEGRRRVW
ncbi:MAG: knotted carbamoyltransferase YgeW [Deltaproteobacteria bacterium]